MIAIFILSVAFIATVIAILRAWAPRALCSAAGMARLRELRDQLLG